MLDELLSNHDKKIKSYFETSISHVSMGYEISASEVCLSGGENPQKFATLLTALGLTIEPPIDVQLKVDQSDEANDFLYNWKPSDKEIDSYPFVCKYLLEKFSIFSGAVGNGENCLLGKLYNEQVFSLRPYAGAHDSDSALGDKVVFRFQLSGRPDIIAFKEMSVPYHRGIVTFAIEIKRTGDMKSQAKLTSALKEAETHLIGLNVANTFSSPPLLLTNLNMLNYVMWVKQGSSVEKLAYSIVQRKFVNIFHAVSFIKTELLTLDGVRPCCTRDFGRSPSPPCSVDSRSGLIIPGSFGQILGEDEMCESEDENDM